MASQIKSVYIHLLVWCPLWETQRSFSGHLMVLMLEHSQQDQQVQFGQQHQGNQSNPGIEMKGGMFIRNNNHRTLMSTVVEMTEGAYRGSGVTTSSRWASRARGTLMKHMLYYNLCTYKIGYKLTLSIYKNWTYERSGVASRSGRARRSNITLSTTWTLLTSSSSQAISTLQESKWNRSVFISLTQRGPPCKKIMCTYRGSSKSRRSSRARLPTLALKWTRVMNNRGSSCSSNMTILLWRTV